MRVDYSEDEEYGGQFHLWQSNCRRSRRGKKGQAALRELEAALIALPNKRIQKDVFVERSGETCAIGALMLHRKVSAGMTRQQAEEECAALDRDDTEEHGISVGLPRLVAWSVAVENDEWNREDSPEERYLRILGWVRGELVDGPQAA